MARMGLSISRIPVGLMPLKRALTTVGLGRSYSWDDVRVAFIVSTGRTATHFLAHLLDEALDNTLAVHEPGPQVYDLGVRLIRGELSLREAV